MTKLLWTFFTVAAVFLATPASAVEMMFGLGLDAQVADNDLDPQGTFGHPDGEIEIGWGAVFHTRFYLREKFGLRSGVEIISRQLTQKYEDGFIFTSVGGETTYDVLSVDIPLFFEFYLGNGKHTLYFGPKIGVAIYDHCSQNIRDFLEAKQCVDDAVNDVFALFQVGYMLRLSEMFGLTFFAEHAVLPIVDGGGLESTLFRTGAVATFYF